jgi:hypothetical protein
VSEASKSRNARNYLIYISILFLLVTLKDPAAYGRNIGEILGMDSA